MLKLTYSPWYPSKKKKTDMEANERNNQRMKSDYQADIDAVISLYDNNANTCPCTIWNLLQKHNKLSRSNTQEFKVNNTSNDNMAHEQQIY